MGHEVARRDRRRHTRLQFAVVVKALEHLGRGEVRQQFADRLVDGLPCSTGWVAAALVTALVIEAIQNTLSVVIALSLGW